MCVRVCMSVFEDFYKAKHARVRVCTPIKSVPVKLNLQWYIPQCPENLEISFP